MKYVKSSAVIQDGQDAKEMMKRLEKAARTAYKSEAKITEESSEKLIANLISREHESVLEHEKITVYITCDRAIANALERHRHFSYTQESTHYCNYAKDKFNNEITIIKQPFVIEDTLGESLVNEVFEKCEQVYVTLINLGYTPPEARIVLPLGLKTEVVMTGNIRAWREMLMQRLVPFDTPSGQEVAELIFIVLYDFIPVCFQDIKDGRRRCKA
jgi:thymidylate synthase (FAD)